MSTHQKFGDGFVNVGKIDADIRHLQAHVTYPQGDATLDKSEFIHLPLALRRVVAGPLAL